MKIKILTLVFCLMALGSYIHSMDQENFTSSYSSPSSVSADPEALTFEQMEKEKEERELNSSTSDSELKEDEDNDQEWYCERKFPKTNSELDFLNIFKSAIGQDETNYSGISLCPLDNGKFAVLYEVKFNDFYRRIRIFDTRTGKCLSVIDPLEGEKGFILKSVPLCKLSKDRMACVLNSSFGKDKKIKIYDINSGIFLKDIIIEGKYIESFMKNESYYLEPISLIGNKLAIMIKNDGLL